MGFLSKALRGLTKPRNLLQPVHYFIGAPEYDPLRIFTPQQQAQQSAPPSMGGGTSQFVDQFDPQALARSLRQVGGNIPSQNYVGSNSMGNTGIAPGTQFGKPNFL